MSFKNYAKTAAAVFLAGAQSLLTGCASQPVQGQQQSQVPALYWRGKIGNEQVDLTVRVKDAYTPYDYTMLRRVRQDGVIEIYVDKYSNGLKKEDGDEHRTVVKRKGHFNPITDQTQKTYKSYLDKALKRARKQ